LSGLDKQACPFDVSTVSTLQLGFLSIIDHTPGLSPDSLKLLYNLLYRSEKISNSGLIMRDIEITDLGRTG